MKVEVKIEFDLDESWGIVPVDIELLFYLPRERSLNLIIFGRNYVLEQVVDESQQINDDVLRVTNLGNDLILWGGVNMYLITKHGPETRIQLPRLIEFTEYWHSKLLRLAGMKVFVFESCVLRIDRDFHIVWLTEIYYDLGLLRYDSSCLEFEDADGYCWILTLSDGLIKKVRGKGTD